MRKRPIPFFKDDAGNSAPRALMRRPPFCSTPSRLSQELNNRMTFGSFKKEK